MKKLKFDWLKDWKPSSIAASTKTRTFRVGGYSVFATVIVLAIAVFANIFVNALPTSLTLIDTTWNKIYSLSEQTEIITEQLEQEVTIYWVVQSGEEDINLEHLLDQYDGLSDKISVVKKDPDVSPTFVEKYTDGTMTNNSLIVESGNRFRYVDYSSDIYLYDYSSYYYDGSYSVEFDGESCITSAIDYVVKEELPKMYLLTGHGETTFSSSFQSAVEKQNIETEELSLLTLEAVPEDADCVLIYAPQSDISVDEKQILMDYMENGGNIICITDPPQDETLTNLDLFLDYYGIQLEEGIVIEGDQSYYMWGTPYYLLPDMTNHSITSALMDGGYNVLLPAAQGITIKDDLRDTLTVTELLTTSEEAYSKTDGYNLTTYDKEEQDIEGPFALAVAVTETLEDDTEAKLVYVTTSALLDDNTNSEVSGGNEDFFLNSVSWMCGENESDFSIRAKNIDYSYLTIDSSTATKITVLIIGVIPLCYLGIGIYVWIRRKRR